MNPDGISGTLFVASYLISPGQYGTVHYGDPAFLKSWLGCADFQMVK